MEEPETNSELDELINIFSGITGISEAMPEAMASVYPTNTSAVEESYTARLCDMRVTQDFNSAFGMFGRNEALLKLADLTIRIQECSNDGNNADASIKALHIAVGGLKQISDTNMNVALFWKQVKKHCDNMAEANMKSKVEAALKYPAEKRRKMWTSNAFKLQAVQEYSKWLAMEQISNTYAGAMKATEDDLHKYMREHPVPAIDDIFIN